MTEEMYLAARGALCPSCGRTNPQGDSVTINDGQVVQEMHCNKCEAEWVDIYNLVGMHKLP
jgi:formate dehydrogenase maturation protein FdhE